MNLPKWIVVTCSAIVLASCGNGSSTLISEPKPGNSGRTFADWCRQRASLIPEAKRTVDVLLQKAGTTECDEANQKLSLLTELSLRSHEISDIKPLESLTNLTVLNLRGNKISDIKPLESLTNVTVLNLRGNKISDLKPLQSLTKLTELDLSFTQISDIKPLASLTKLIDLDLGDNKISDIKPLKSLTKLTHLVLSGNEIIEFNKPSPLVAKRQPGKSGQTFADWCRKKADLSLEAKHTVEVLLQKARTTECDEADRELFRLTELDLGANQISDLKPLESLTKLTELHLGANQISDLKPLESLTRLTELGLINNKITDIKPLQSLTNLTGLTLESNQIGDIKPLASLTKLTFLSLGLNPIVSKICPLKPESICRWEPVS
ncbi:leucine-rich repeat protein [Microcoleus sp. B13-B4]